MAGRCCFLSPGCVDGCWLLQVANWLPSPPTTTLSVRGPPVDQSGHIRVPLPSQALASGSPDSKSNAQKLVASYAKSACRSPQEQDLHMLERKYIRAGNDLPLVLHALCF
jgi:hypothetical protein